MQTDILDPILISPYDSEGELMKLEDVVPSPDLPMVKQCLFRDFQIKVRDSKLIEITDRFTVGNTKTGQPIQIVAKTYSHKNKTIKKYIRKISEHVLPTCFRETGEYIFCPANDNEVPLAMRVVIMQSVVDGLRTLDEPFTDQVGPISFDFNEERVLVTTDSDTRLMS